jgi:hypothetical protein
LTIIIPANSAADTGYEVANSCRFNRPDSAYLNFSQGNGNRKDFTWSGWIKRSSSGLLQLIWHCNNAGHYSWLGFDSSDRLQYYSVDGSTVQGSFVSTQVFRDQSAWYHIVARFEMSNATEDNRIRFYVNGSEITVWTTKASIPSQNTDLEMNVSGHTFRIGTYANSSDFVGMYMSEISFCDGQSYAPTSFGEFDEDSPTIWKPKDISGLTFGTNGFWLDFEDSSALGNDVSGENNDFTPANLAATDQATDTPTNNFCTLNSLDNYYASYTFSEGNCKIDGTPSPTTYRTGTMGVASGKWYWEVNITAAPASNASRIGFTSVVSTSTTHILGSDIYGWAQNGNNGNIEGQASQSGSAASTSYGNSHTTDDIIGIALNLDDDEVKFYKNGTVENSGTAFQINKANAPNGFFFPAIGEASTSNSITAIANFGNPAWALSSAVNDENGYGNFEYSVPSGFLALCTKNLGSDGG